MSFTDKVVLGQEGGYGVHSACSNITFENCTFDLSESTEAKNKKFAISRTLTGPSIDCFTDLTVKNCSFKNADRAISMTTDLSGITVENCKFENLASYAVYIVNASGDIKIKNNTANNTKGVLQIGTVGNTFATSGDANSVIIIDNVAENMACDNKKVFWAGNGSSNIESVTFTVTGNRCTYTNGSTYVGFYIEHADGSVKGAEKSIEQQ